jgi:hypothetical protein
MLVLGLLVLSAASAGCGGNGSTTNASISPEIASSGFPLGTFTKEIRDPFLGRVRLAWTFAGDGRWAEVPEALDGQRLDAPVVRGSFGVTADTLTIATEYPPDWGTSEHTWRLEGRLLWTDFVSSDVDGDADWFAMLDTQPWVPLE